jgi:hypothetical protein
MEFPGAYQRTAKVRGQGIRLLPLIFVIVTIDAEFITLRPESE